MTNDTERNRMKQRAAECAVAELRDGMVLGLGSGSTVDFVLTEVARRIAAGLTLVGIPSSHRTAERARQLGIPLSDFTVHRRIDLTIDGADQVERGTLTLVKGLGGALLREKIIAEASDRMIVVADETKLVEQLNGTTPLPVEITPFGWPVIIDRLTALGVAPLLRVEAGQAVVTDNGNYLADCCLAAIPEPARLERALMAVAGVVATGLFIGLASVAIIGNARGVETLVRRPAL